MEVDTEIVQNLKLATRIFEKYSDTIRATITFYVNDKSIIDDIYQDLFLSLVRKPIPQNIQNIKGYLQRAIKNDVLDVAFQTKNYRSRNQKYIGLYMNRLKHNTPEDIAIQAEETKQLFNIVKSQLMPREAEAIFYRYRYDLDTDRAAKLMCVNRRSFSHYLCTGLKKIRKFVCECELEPNTPF